VLGVLVEILGGDTVAGRRRIAGERQVFLEHLAGRASDLYVGTAAVKRILL
jgi:hypothetical protein